MVAAMSAMPSRGTPAVSCPYCGSPEVVWVADWGGQLISSQCRCRACHTYFEAIDHDRFEPPIEADGWFGDATALHDAAHPTRR